MLNNFRKNKPAQVFAALVIIILFSAVMSSAFQSAFGAVDVRLIIINDKDGESVVGKLYVPVGVDSSNPAPGILGLHGFNNDKDVERPAAIELARAGFVVLALDELGHGDSEGGYTLDATPYSYFRAYEYLMNLSFVDGDNTGIYGHSMGEIRARQIAAAYPQHKALGLQAFVPSYAGAYYGYYGDPKFHNILHLWAAWEEWGYDGKSVAEQKAQGLAQLDAEYHLAPGTMQVDTNVNLWGGPADFANGSARRESYDSGTHPYITMSPKHTSEIVAWMLQALQGMSYADAWAIANPANQIWLGCEIFGIIACLATLLSILPLAYMLMNTKYFSEVRQPKPEKIHSSKRSSWWIAATVNTVIAGYTYWFFIPGYGNSGSTKNWLFDVKIGDYSVYTHGVANGFAHWFLLNAVIATITWSAWYLMTRWRKGRESISLHDMGLTFATKDELAGLSLPKKAIKAFNPRIITKTAILAFLLFGWMYMLVTLSQHFLNVEFRGFWTMMKAFSGVQRAVDFWPYFGIVFFFTMINCGVFMYGQIRMKEYKNTYITHAVWWFKYMYAMIFGLVVVMLVQYAPQWFGGTLTSRIPGTEEPMFSVARMMVIQLMGAIPVFATFFFLSINLYRQTGRIYLSSIMMATLIVWFEMTALVAYV
jgi:pimeloyl-ACP methyl ester carboxylesterase